MKKLFLLTLCLTFGIVKYAQCLSAENQLERAERCSPHHKCDYTTLDMKIIRTKESTKNGATFVGNVNVSYCAGISPVKLCQMECCNSEKPCNLAVFKEKGSSCYLFYCGPINDNRCLFTDHPKFTSTILTGRDDEEADDVKQLEKLRGRNKAKETKPKESPTLPPSTTIKSTKASFISLLQSLLDELEGLDKDKTVQHGCGSFQFKCVNEGDPSAYPRCVAVYDKCDGIQHCRDGSDEKNCAKSDGSNQLASQALIQGFLNSIRHQMDQSQQPMASTANPTTSSPTIHHVGKTQQHYGRTLPVNLMKTNAPVNTGFEHQNSFGGNWGQGQLPRPFYSREGVSSQRDFLPKPPFLGQHYNPTAAPHLQHAPKEADVKTPVRTTLPTSLKPSATTTRQTTPREMPSATQKPPSSQKTNFYDRNPFANYYYDFAASNHDASPDYHYGNFQSYNRKAPEGSAGRPANAGESKGGMEAELSDAALKHAAEFHRYDAYDGGSHRYAAERRPFYEPRQRQYPAAPPPKTPLVMDKVKEETTHSNTNVLLQPGHEKAVKEPASSRASTRAPATLRPEAPDGNNNGGASESEDQRHGGSAGDDDAPVVRHPLYQWKKLRSRPLVTWGNSEARQTKTKDRQHAGHKSPDDTNIDWKTLSSRSPSHKDKNHRSSTTPAAKAVTSSPSTRKKTDSEGALEVAKSYVRMPDWSKQGPMVALALGLAITVVLAVFIGCKLRTAKRRLRRGKLLSSNDADYLINGMYL